MIGSHSESIFLVKDDSYVNTNDVGGSCELLKVGSLRIYDDILALYVDVVQPKLWNFEFLLCFKVLQYSQTEQGNESERKSVENQFSHTKRRDALIKPHELLVQHTYEQCRQEVTLHHPTDYLIVRVDTLENSAKHDGQSQDEGKCLP